jgi:nucleoside-triphosphatase THEP1
MRYAVPPPEALVESLRREARPRLVLLTGGRGSGKTHWCLAVRDAACRTGITVAGVVSPPVHAHGGKFAIEVMDAASGERRRLAVRPPRNETGTAGLGWRFDAAALAWGDAVLQNAPACDLLLIDELGPLEFCGEGGFSHGFAAIAARRYRLAIIVVRPERLPDALARWPGLAAIYDRDLA